MKYLSLSFLVLLGFNLFVWQGVLVSSQDDLNIYFLDVGQGDSELVILPGGVKLLIDGGPNKEVLFELAEVLSDTDRYIDLIALTHPQTDHFGGLYDVIERYEVGAFLVTGREGDNKAWDDFKELLYEKDIPIVIIEAGDIIRQGENIIKVLSPDENLLANREVNESSLVFLLDSENSKTLFTGDAGFPIEKYIVDAYDINVDILKVGHHGSRFSTGLSFLQEATPAISVIQVGKNRFGHPTEQTLSRLIQSGSQVYRTDENGRVHIKVNDGVVGVFLEN